MSQPTEAPIAGFRPLAAPAHPPTTTPATRPIAPPASVGPPAFQRVPRDYVPPPGEPFEIQEPPPAPGEPSTSFGSVLVTLLPALVMVLVAVGFVAFAAGTGQALFLLFTIPLLVASVPIGIYSYSHERRKYRQLVARRADEYRAYLESRRAVLTALRARQRAADRVSHPDPDGCRARAERRDNRLWERSPHDPDFLDLRLGRGRVPASFPIKPPAPPPGTLVIEPLLADALTLAAEGAWADDLAVALPLGRVGSAGLIGPRGALRDLTRALLTQLATHHAPDETKLVVVAPEEELAEWAWARWLPHTWREDRARRFVAATPVAARNLLGEVYETLKRRRVQQEAAIIAARRPLPVYVIVFADPGLLAGADAAAVRPLLQLILRNGREIGAHALFLVGRRDAVPQECGAVVDLTGGGKRLELVGPPRVEAVFAPDGVDAWTAEGFARILAPLRLRGSLAEGELPPSVPLLDLLGTGRVEDLPISEWWGASRPFDSLAAPIGVRARGEPLPLDLHQFLNDPRHHGPNGLIAGTVGSGKSEVLLTLIAGLAARYHPHEVVFALLDFKGGGMADQVAGLPHVVSTITDLELALVPRAITSLTAELERRKRIFREASARVGWQVNDLDEYLPLFRQGLVEERLPYLILIVDEFTVLKGELPDAMSAFVTVAIQGRALGFRMILATQKPAGVISGQIESNTRFRICLRVALAEDSQEMLGRPDAAALSGAGRAYLRVGQDEVFELFQAAWSGAPYVPDAHYAEDLREIAEVALDGRRRLLGARAGVRAEAGPSGQTQLRALVAQLCEVAARQGLPRLTGPWLPPLPRTIELASLRDGAGGWDGRGWAPTTDWLAPIVGLVDDPARQAQAPLALPLGRDGHLAVFGGPGSGKTTFVQTLVASLALQHPPRDLWLYLLDFSGRSLSLFAPLPHVGGVILGHDTERLKRLLRMLATELDRRRALLAGAGVSTLGGYRAQVADAPPDIVVVLDNNDYAAFDDLYPELAAALPHLAAEGGGYGIHLVLTGAIPYRLRQNFALAVALELTDRDAYAEIVGQTYRAGSNERLAPTPGIRGRGLVRGVPPLEFQTALAAPGATDAARADAVRILVETLAAAHTGPGAATVPVLPDRTSLCELLPATDHWAEGPDGHLAVPLALDAETLEPVTIDLADGPYFLITGPPEADKAGLVQTWLLALAERFPPQRVAFYLASLGGTGLVGFGRLQHTVASAEDEEQFGALLDDIERQIERRATAADEARRRAGGALDERSFLARFPALVLVLDDFERFQAGAGPLAAERLEGTMRRGRRLGFHLLVAGAAGEFAAYDTLTNAIKAGQTGFLLGSSHYDDLSLFTSNPRLPTAEADRTLPPGRGYLLRRGYPPRPIQVATCHSGPLQLEGWLARLARKQTLPPVAAPSA